MSGGQWLTMAVLAGAPVILLVLWFADVIRPGSFQRSGVRDGGRHPWWVWLAAGALVYLSGMFVGSVVQASLGVPSFMSTPLKGEVIVTVSRALAGIAAGAALVRMLRESAPAGGTAVRWSDLWTGTWCLILAMPVIMSISMVSAYVSERMSGAAPDHLAHNTLKEMAGSGGDPWVWGLRAALVLLVPVFEELVFRVGLQTAVLKATRRPWAAILVATAVFTAAHVGAVPGHALAVIAALSISIGIAYERTKRLGVPVVMHALFNGINLAMAAWG